MKLGFLSSILPEYTFEQVIDFAADNGFSCVELACWPLGKAQRRYAGVTHIDMSTLNNDKVKYIKNYTDEKNIKISAIGYYPNLLCGDLEQRNVYINHLKECIIGAEKLGVELVNTFIGKNRLLPMNENLDEFNKVWPEIIKFAEMHKVNIGIENCPMYFWDEWPSGDNLASNPKFWKEMFSRIPSEYFGLNYDPSHLVWQRMNYIKPILEFKEKLFHFHIKDAKFYQEKYDQVGAFAAPLEYHTPKLPGLGDIKWGEVISALNDVEYKGAIVIEVEDRAYENSLKDRIDAIILSKNFIKQYIR